VLVPNSTHLIEEGFGKAEPVGIRKDHTLKCLGVSDEFNLVLTEPDQVVIANKSSWLLLSHHNATNPQEDAIDRRVLLVKGIGSVNSSGTFEGLQYKKQFRHELSAFSGEELFVKMDSEIFVVTKDLEVNDLAFLIPVKPHGNNVPALSMSLTPLFGLRVVELEANNSTADIAHNVCPEEHVDFFIFESEERIDFLKRTKVKSTSISPALLVARRDRSKLRVPCLSLFIARLELLSGDWVCVFVH